MIDLYDYVVQKIHEIVPGPKTRHSNGLNFRCPICGDSRKSKSKKRGWLYKDSGRASFYCYNCGASLGAYQFISALENKSVKEVKRDIFQLYRNQNDGSFSAALEEMFNDSPSTSGEVVEERKPPGMDIQASWMPLESSEDGSRYVHGRKVLEAPFAPSSWTLYYDSKRNRIVIPWIRDGEMKYYQLRSLCKGGAKYLFPKDLSKDVFGVDEIDHSFDRLFLMEGVFDSVWVRNGIAIGGLNLTAHQRAIMREFELQFRTVFMPDNQWVDRDSRRKSLEVAKAGGDVFVWPKSFECKDVNEYVLKCGTNPFEDREFLETNTLSGIKAYMRLSFNK